MSRKSNKQQANKNLDIEISNLLIELIKGMEIIYNRNHPEANNAAKRAKLWKSITNVINESFRCGWTVEKSRRKWRSLRDGFVKHLRIKELRGIDTGYPYYKQMEFLLQFYTSSTETITSEEDTVFSSTNATAADQQSDMSQVQIIKCDSSDSIHIDDTVYVDDGNAHATSNGTTANNLNFSMPTVVIPNSSSSTINNSIRNFDQIPVTMTNRSTPAQANNTNMPVNHQQQNGGTVAPDPDEHEIFGELVVREMRKMTPDAKKTFKRNVTQLLYS